MPVVDKEQVTDAISSAGHNTALKTAAAAAATGAATYAVRRALAQNGSGRQGAARAVTEKSHGLVQSALASGWDAAAEVLVPLVEDAAEAAGKYTAEHAPDIVRERIVPKFIEAFENAK
jgi:hypothetical protein